MFGLLLAGGYYTDHISNSLMTMPEVLLQWDNCFRPLMQYLTNLSQYFLLYLYPGYRAYRHFTRGSWIIRDLITAVAERCHEDDLASIAEHVSQYCTKGYLLGFSTITAFCQDTRSLRTRNLVGDFRYIPSMQEMNTIGQRMFHFLILAK